MSECIHGFEGTQCDQCFPKERPQPVRRAAPGRSPRAAGSAAPRPAGRPAMLRTGEMRVYHVSHISNLPSILDDGGLRADAAPVLDVSSELARELRSSAEVAPGRPVSDHVSFSLAPDSTTWNELRQGAVEPRWSSAARASTPGDFVFFVTTIAALGPEAVVADGDAAGTYTRFSTTPSETERMLARLHSDPEARAAAEALAPSSVDLSAVQLIGVANDPVRERVRALLATAGVSTKVAVYPPWFATD